LTRGTVSPGDTAVKRVVCVSTCRASARARRLRAMPHIQTRWTPEEKEAIGLALVDGGMTAKEAVNAAAEGLLRAHGQILPPFGPMPPATALDCARKLRLRRAGRAAGQIDKLPVRDVVEGVRLALARMLHGEITAMERTKPGKRDVERIRQLARAARELQALVDKDAPAPPALGSKAGGSSPTSGGLGGAILRAHGTGRVSTPVQEAHKTEAHGDTGHARSEAQYEATHSTAHHAASERRTQQSEQAEAQPGTVLGMGQH
jgi:hypothetical protein